MFKEFMREQVKFYKKKEKDFIRSFKPARTPRTVKINTCTGYSYKPVKCC